MDKDLDLILIYSACILGIGFISFVLPLILASPDLIDIGPGADNRAASLDYPEYTWIDTKNPANDTGIITTIQIYSTANLTGVKVGTFTDDGDNKFTNRDVAIIGNVEGGAQREFTGLSIDVVSGDVLGIYWAVGTGLEMDNFGGVLLSYKSGDQFGQGQQTYSQFGSNMISIYGTGETVPTDTCTCAGLNEDWEIDMSDYCNITDACDLGTGTLNFTGAGWCNCNASVDTTNLGDPGASGVFYIQDSCKITID